MKIAVVLTDGTFDVVGADELNALLKKRELRTFLRSDGWVQVGYDLLRDSRSADKYDGKERRNRTSLTKLRCDYCGKEFYAENADSSYSVIVVNNGSSIQIVEDELIYGAYHYCSGPCLCRREHGTFSIEQLHAQEELEAM